MSASSLAAQVTTGQVPGPGPSRTFPSPPSAFTGTLTLAKALFSSHHPDYSLFN